MSDPAVFTVAKADPTGTHEPLPGAVLNITADLGQVRETLPWAIWRRTCLNMHEVEARQVVAALVHLPQGTIDQVLVLLLQQRASLLRIAGPFPPHPGIPGLPEEPPEAFRSAVATTLEEVRRDDRGERPSLPRITPEGAAGALWFALRHLVPAAAKEGA